MSATPDEVADAIRKALGPEPAPAPAEQAPAEPLDPKEARRLGSLAMAKVLARGKAEGRGIRRMRRLMPPKTDAEQADQPPAPGES